MATREKKRRRSFLSRHPRLKRLVYSLYGLLAIPLILLPLPLFILPKRWLYAAGRRLGALFVYPAIREKVVVNLTYVYGERMTTRRANAIALKVAANVIWFILDCYYLWMFSWTFKIDNIVVATENRDIVDNELRPGKGLIVASAHYGCFEIMPVYFLKKGITTVGGVIARSFPSPLFTWLNRKLRMRAGIPSFYDQVKDVFRTLRSNGVIGVLPDLCAKRRLGIPATCYGKPTLTFDIHVRIASQMRCPIIPAFLVRRPRKPWQYSLTFYPAITVPRKADRETISQKVQEINDALEYHIMRFPSGWFWFHNKWNALEGQTSTIN